MANTLYNGDLPANLNLGKVVAIDTETLGLQVMRDRLCVVQLSSGDGNAHIVRFEPKNYAAPNLRKLLADKSVQKLFLFARFDLGAIKYHMDIMVENVYCTRTASRFARTYTDSHGLKNIVEEYLGTEISKKQQSSYWGGQELTNKQLEYAANDVVYLHKIKSLLDERLKREERFDLAMRAMDHIGFRVELDLAGWPEDIYAH